jgi:hypothetical protein
MRLLITALIYLTVLSSCKKDSSNKADCEANNYGVYRVNFTSTTLQHHILVTIGFGYRQKDVPAGTLTDTLHIEPGTFSVFITSTNGGPAIDTEITSATITQCNETVKNVTF